jgi:RnfABCDGE-type electron transport complex D subunit
MAVSKQIPLVKWQLPMKRVLYALAPLVLASVYFFGWKSLIMLLAVNLAGFFAEYLFARYYKEPVSSSVFVTNTLFMLILPPTLPIWMGVVGIIFGVVFGKMVFGGFGKNVFNPALVGRAFIYINFGLQMTGRWSKPFSGFPGGFAAYAADATTGATPMKIMAEGGQIEWLKLLFGNTSGCFGETSAVLIVIGGLYLIWRKHASWKIVISCLLSFLALQALLFWGGGAEKILSPMQAMLSGGFMLGLLFMATDPITAPKRDGAKYVYGILIGVLTVIIRTYSVWAEGMMFAILLANMFAPITDFAFNEYFPKKAKRK